MPQSSALPAVTAVVVLYRREPHESEAISSLVSALSENEELASQVSVLLYDNSPQPQSFSAPHGVAMRYVHDPANGGLAAAYNFALDAAATTGHAWLLLLDQDTTLSLAYFEELLQWTKSMAGRKDVAAIVPKLWAGSRLYSPTSPFLSQIRRQFARGHCSIEIEASGVQQRSLTAYNSGAALRISALHEIGAFPEGFWLDYLDHAIFQELDNRGYRLCVMSAVLQHNLSHMDLNEVPFWRHWSVLAAQTRFVLTFGGFIDRLFFRWWLLKTSRTFRAACQDKRIWRARAKQAFLLRQLKPKWEK